LDQRRFLSFLLIAFAVFLLVGQLFPPPPRPEKPPAAAGPGKDKAAPKGAPAAGDAKKAQAEIEKPAPADQAAKPGELPAIAASSLPAQFVALGSLDPKSGYRMLVTLTNAGAAVLRAEMASERYRDQHDWSGYLGDLELKNVPDGAQVQVVGAGTPAAIAKIEAGDVIVGVGNPQKTPIKTKDDLLAALTDTKPDQEITLQVRRGGNAAEARTVQLMRRPFAVVRPEIENYRMRKVDPPAGFSDPPSFLLTLSELNGKQLNPGESKRIAGALETGNWELAAHDEKSASFRRVLPELKLEIIKRYTLAMAPPEERQNVNYPAYHLQLDIELHNTDKAERSAAYSLDGPTGMPLEGWWYARKVGSASVRNVVARAVSGKEVQISNADIAKEKVQPITGDALVNAGVDGLYFSAVLIPQLAALDDNWFSETEPIIVSAAPDVRNAPYANVTCRLSRKSVSLAAGARQRDSFEIFLGPKRPDLLSQYYPRNAQGDGDSNYSLSDLNYYGWFGPVARVMLWILHGFYSIVGNYGIAIILLTVSVRGLMFPISYRQTQNMARIQALKPEMDRISEKYKNDMQKKSQATQELYRKHSINPLGGCLPLVLQMPIFIGLYRALMVDVELRQSTLFGPAIHWCSNLAAPDMFFDWSSFMPQFFTEGMLGPYLNILPIVTVSIMLVTQKMSMPPPTNEQAAMQQKMMKYMMIFFALMFYKVASGLCLYLICSSLWGIAERKLLPKAQAAGAGTTSTTNIVSPGSNGSPGTKRPRKAKRKK
jgi:YidC/Oxa1 family membrane protein insertase